MEEKTITKTLTRTKTWKVLLGRNRNYPINQPRKFLVWKSYYLHITFISRSSAAKQAEFDPTELVKKKEGTFTVPAVITEYLEKRMKRCLTKDEREALIKDHPKPDSPSCKVPTVDKFIKEFLGKRFPKEEDGELAKIQAATLLPVCPLAFAWNSLLESGADKDPDMLVPVTEVISMIQHTICLIGNASEFISQIRHTRILEKLDTSWSKYGQEDFSDLKDTLFGEDFQQTLVSKVEKEAVLAKVVVASKRSKENRGKESSSSHRRDNYGCSQFFRGSPSAGYRGRQGKNFQPYNTSQKKESGYDQGRYFSNTQKRIQSLFHEPKLPLQQGHQSNQFKK